MEKEIFVGHVGKIIKVNCPDIGLYELKVKDVLDLTPPPEGVSDEIRRAPFCVIVEGCKSHKLGSDFYRCELPGGDDLDMVISAESEEELVYNYSIIFN